MYYLLFMVHLGEHRFSPYHPLQGDLLQPHVVKLSQELRATDSTPTVEEWPHQWQWWIQDVWCVGGGYCQWQDRMLLLIIPRVCWHGRGGGGRDWWIKCRPAHCTWKTCNGYHSLFVTPQNEHMFTTQNLSIRKWLDKKYETLQTWTKYISC